MLTDPWGDGKFPPTNETEIVLFVSVILNCFYKSNHYAWKQKDKKALKVVCVTEGKKPASIYGTCTRMTAELFNKTCHNVLSNEL